METQIIQGTLRADGSLELAEKPQIASGPVEITLRSKVPARTSGEGWWPYLQRARRELEEMGHQFMTEEEVKAHIEDLRSGDERLDAIYEEMEQQRKSGQKGC